MFGFRILRINKSLKPILIFLSADPGFRILRINKSLKRFPASLRFFIVLESYVLTSLSNLHNRQMLVHVVLESYVLTSLSNLAAVVAETS